MILVCFVIFDCYFKDELTKQSKAPIIVLSHFFEFSLTSLKLVSFAFSSQSIFLSNS